MAGRKRTCVVCFCVVWVIFSSSVLMAQPKDKEQLNRQIKSAQTNYNAKRFDTARREYLIAYELGAKPWVLFNVAICYEKVEKIIAATKAFKRYLTLETETEKYAQLIGIAKKKIEELSGKLVHLRIEDAPPDSTVYVNGEAAADAWKTTPIEMDPGYAEITIVCDGYETMFKRISVRTGADVYLSAKLTPKPTLPLKAPVYVACSAKRSRIYMNGKLVGSCPMSYNLYAGEHSLQIKVPGKKTYEKKFIMKKGHPITIPVTLKPIRWHLAGIPTAIIGAALIGVGGGLTGMYIDTHHRTKKVSEGSFQAQIDAAEDDYEKGLIDIEKLEERRAGIRTKFDEYCDNDNDSDGCQNWDERENDWEALKNGAITSYVIGGTALAIGAGLIIYYLVQKKEKGHHHGVSVRYTHLSISF